MQALGFADSRPRGLGTNDTPSTLNVPGLANVGYLPVLTWANPRMDSLAFQALVPRFGKTPEELGARGKGPYQTK